jgi:hypothetical protein
MRLDRLVAGKSCDLSCRAIQKRVSDFAARRIVARLQHPSIVAVRLWHVARRRRVLVMELVRKDLCRGFTKDDSSHSGPWILTAVCSAIEAAHREGVLRSQAREHPSAGGGTAAKVLISAWRSW